MGDEKVSNWVGKMVGTLGKQKAKHWEEEMVYCMVEMKEEKKADWRE